MAFWRKLSKAWLKRSSLGAAHGPPLLMLTMTNHMSKHSTLIDYLSSADLVITPASPKELLFGQNASSPSGQKQHVKLFNMEFSINTIVLFGSVIFTGLSAGLFYGWSVSVIPGTLKVTDLNYLQTMQSINRAILNPAFFAVFFGSLALMGTSTVMQFSISETGFWLMLLATACYLVGMVGLTGFGNVPLNNQLDALNLGNMSTTDLSEFRHYYESRWNRLQHARMVCGILAFGLALASAFMSIKNLSSAGA